LREKCRVLIFNEVGYVLSAVRVRVKSANNIISDDVQTVKYKYRIF